jgi:hypothetical protein
MLDRAVALTLRNLSTLFLLGAIVFVPLHLAHAFAFRNVLSVADIRGDISEFPEGKKVRNVGTEELGDERSTLLVLLLVEAGISVLLVGGARRVVEIDDGDGVPTVTDAWSHALPLLQTVPVSARSSGPLLVCGSIGVLAAFLIYRIGALATELLGDDKAFVGVGLSRGAAVALFVTFVIGPVAALSTGNRPNPAPQSLDVY